MFLLNKYVTFVKMSERFIHSKKREAHMYSIMYNMRYKRLHNGSATQKNDIYPSSNKFLSLLLFSFSFSVLLFPSHLRPRQNTKNLILGQETKKKRRLML